MGDRIKLIYAEYEMLVRTKSKYKEKNLLLDWDDEQRIKDLRKRLDSFYSEEDDEIKDPEPEQGPF